MCKFSLEIVYVRAIKFDTRGRQERQGKVGEEEIRAQMKFFFFAERRKSFCPQLWDKRAC